MTDERLLELHYLHADPDAPKSADRRLLDAVNTLFTRNGGPHSLAQIYESVQAQIHDKLTESDRRQIKDIIHSHCQQGLIRDTGQGRYDAEAGFSMGKLHICCGTVDKMYHADFQQSVRYIISDRQEEAFALRDVYGFWRFYDDTVRNKHMVKEFIDWLCKAGELERVGRRYRATASFEAGSAPKGFGDANFAMVKYFLRQRRRLESRVLP